MFTDEPVVKLNVVSAIMCDGRFRVRYIDFRRRCMLYVGGLETRTSHGLVVSAVTTDATSFP